MTSSDSSQHLHTWGGGGGGGVVGWYTALVPKVSNAGKWNTASSYVSCANSQRGRAFTQSHTPLKNWSQTGKLKIHALLYFPPLWQQCFSIQAWPVLSWSPQACLGHSRPQSQLAHQGWGRSVSTHHGTLLPVGVPSKPRGPSKGDIRTLSGVDRVRGTRVARRKQSSMLIVPRDTLRAMHIATGMLWFPSVTSAPNISS